MPFVATTSTSKPSSGDPMRDLRDYLRGIDIEKPEPRSLTGVSQRGPGVYSLEELARRVVDKAQ